MRVARSFGADDVRIEEHDDPEPGPGEVVCDVLACGVCASDVTDWYVAARLPAVLGHEPTGVVRSVGAGVDNVAVGDRVAIHHHTPCGECRRCRRGHETMCERFRATRLDPGGFAERVRLVPELVGRAPRPPRRPGPRRRNADRTAGVRAARAGALGPARGDSLLVVGAGVNGLLSIAAAHARGVDAVWVREPRSDRLARALATGAERHGNELVDVAIVCTPKPDAIAAAAEAVAPGGTVCLYAPPAPDAPPRLDGTALFMRELTVTASYSAGPADMRTSLELIAGGAVDPRPLISHRLPLEETAAALNLQRQGEAIKAVVEPYASRTPVSPRVRTILQVLDDPARVADRLAIDHQHRHPALIGQRLDLGAPRATLRDRHLGELDPVAAQRPRDLSAGTQPVRRRRAPVERRHLTSPCARVDDGWRGRRAPIV